MLVVSERNSQSTIISIISEQSSALQFENVSFLNNYLNAFTQDLSIYLSTTIFIIQLQRGNFRLLNSIFQENIITNSSNSNMYIQALNIEIQNTIFSQNNYLNLSKLINKIIFEKSTEAKIVYESDLIKQFTISSKRGIGYLLTINGSYSILGGGFYIDVFEDSVIEVVDSCFQNTQASFLKTYESNGGCFYIDANAAKLRLIIKNTRFFRTFSRNSGGSIYIQPSLSYNQIQIENISIIDCFSLTSSFLDFALVNLNEMQSNVLIKDTQIKQTQSGFNNYLSMLSQFIKEEANTLLNNNFMFLIFYSNITIQNCKFQSEVGTFFASLDQCFTVTLSDTLFFNSLISSSPILKITLKSDAQGNIQMKNVKLESINQQILNFTKQCQVVDEQPSTNFSYRNPNFQINSFVELIQDIEEIQNNQLICNQLIFADAEKANFSLIQINYLTTTHKIIFESIEIESVLCSNCNFGIISLNNIQKNKLNNIQLKNMKISNSNCGLFGCVTIINNEASSEILKINSRRILQQLNYQQLFYSIIVQVSIEKSQFISNNASYGGALCIIGLDIIISFSTFLRNTAKFGGAIYYEKFDETKIILLATQITNNSAQIAGGLYLYETQTLNSNDLGVLIRDNIAKIVGNDISERPSSLAISADGGLNLLSKQTKINSTAQVIEQTIISPYKILGYTKTVKTLTFPSGQSITSYKYFDQSTFTTIPYNLTFRVIALNSRKERELQLDGTTCTLKHKVVNVTSQEEITDEFASLSLLKIQFNVTTYDYNFDDLIISFNPYYSDDIVL